MGPTDDMDGMMTALTHIADAGNSHGKENVGLDSPGVSS